MRASMRALLLGLGVVVGLGGLPAFGQDSRPKEAEKKTPYETIEFASLDGLKITADLYRAHPDPKTPFLLLCHQAGWSRGEYREIAPQLVLLGFDCLAVDQRSGGAVGGVENASFARAVQAEKPTGFTDAEQDLIATLRWARRHHANGRTLVAWGSSYSASLVLRVAAAHPSLIDTWLAFAPGEYFEREGKPKDWIAQAALGVEQPGFLTSAHHERGNWEEIWDNLPGVPNKSRWYFLPETQGNHGSRALWAQFEDSGAYWLAVEPFLDRIFDLERPAPVDFKAESGAAESADERAGG